MHPTTTTSTFFFILGQNFKSFDILKVYGGAQRNQGGAGRSCRHLATGAYDVMDLFVLCSFWRAMVELGLGLA